MGLLRTPPAKRPSYSAPRRGRKRPRETLARRAAHALSSVLIMSGLLLLVDAAATLVWQEPVSALYGRFNQEALADDLTDAERLTELQLGTLEQLNTERRRVGFLARSLRRQAKTGSAIGRIRIARLGIDFVVVQGTDGQTLRKGPGHYPDTTMPGLPGTVAIAGHRTTYGAPFRKLNLMRPGDLIELEMPYGRFIYRTELRRIVSPDAYEYVTRSVDHARLALTACHPLYSAAQRIVVFARLEDVEARGRGRVQSATPEDVSPLQEGRP